MAKKPISIVKPAKQEQAGRLTQAETDMLDFYQHRVNTLQALIQVEIEHMNRYGKALMSRRGLDPEKHRIDAETRRKIVKLAEVPAPRAKEPIPEIANPELVDSKEVNTQVG
jgi:hypothetical protein